MFYPMADFVYKFNYKSKGSLFYFEDSSEITCAPITDERSSTLTSQGYVGVILFEVFVEKDFRLSLNLPMI